MLRRLTPLVSVSLDASAPLREVSEQRERFRDLRPVWRRAGTIMRRSFAENFRQGGRPEKWQPLSPNTIAQKQLIGFEQNFPYASMRGIRRIRRLQQNGQRSLSNILIARGDLRDSWTQKNKNHISRVSLEGFEEGSKHWLAEIHEEGTQPYEIRPRSARRLRFFTTTGFRFARVVYHPGLPARPVGIVQTGDEEAIAQLLDDHLEGRL